MRIIVCIKQVPDTAEVRIDPETNTLIREGVPSIVNPFDENAVEAALDLREAHGGEVVTLSMGPPQVAEALKQTIAMGSDQGVLLSARPFAGADTLATAYTLAVGIRHLGPFDLVICGKQAIDGDTGQVGPGIAENLGIPHITYVRRVTVEGGALRAERVTEDGYEVLETDLPALITVVKEINRPRHPSLRGALKARKAEIPILTQEDLDVDAGRIGLGGSPTQVVRIFAPPPRGNRRRLEGSPEEVAGKLVTALRERHIV